MNVKTLAAIVGTLSLGSLATGCATTHAPAQSSTEKGTQGSCSGKGAESSCSGKGTESSCSGKGTESSCSGKATRKTDTDAQGGDRKAAAPEKGTQGGCGENGCAGGR